MIAAHQFADPAYPVREWRRDAELPGFPPRDDWGVGPWQHEPDKVQYVDADTGLDCLLVRNQFGAWCGYVGVTLGHPYFGVPYMDGPETALTVHGGITFSDFCHEGEPGTEAARVCHVAYSGRPGAVWWLGFDCAHSRDYAPGTGARLRQLGFRGLVRQRWEEYRDMAYVEEEVHRLAAQLAPNG